MSQPNPPEFIATPKRPYLLRAFYEWIVDNGMTPHIMVDARSPKVKVPRQFVKDGSIVLNVSMTAANNLLMDNDQVTFNARFGGKAMSIWLPMWSIMAIYARETQDGLNFPLEEYAESMALATAEGSTTIFTGSKRAMAVATRAKSCCTCANVTPQVFSHNAWL